MQTLTPAQIGQWRRYPRAFIEECLCDPETAQPFKLSDAQSRFLAEAFRFGANRRLLYPEQLFGAIKKSGKSTMSAMFMLTVILIYGGLYAEGYVVANDYQQAQDRVFAAICRIVETSPLLKRVAKISASKIEFPSTGATITAIASDYAGAAGSNPNCVCFDELWGVVSEAGLRLWDEMVPVPTRKVSVRLTTSYAGFANESMLLEQLYKRGLRGREIGPSLYAQPGMLMAWHHGPIAPWQNDDWIAEMRETLRPSAFLRMIQNQFASSESSFVDMSWWDSCVDSQLSPALAEPTLPVWVGVDASVKRDSTAIVCCAFAGGRVRLIWHKVYQPSPDDPLDFENAVEKTLRDLMRRFWVRQVFFDPFQLVAVAQRLTNMGVPMIEFAQSVPNLTEASSNLYEIIKGRNLRLYPDDKMRLAASRAVAVETSRGWRITKEKGSHKIDVIVALAQAALGAVHGQGSDDWKLQVAPSTSWQRAKDPNTSQLYGDPTERDSIEDGVWGPSPAGVWLKRGLSGRSKWDGF
jgi:phage terminase large subunit-like protein